MKRMDEDIRRRVFERDGYTCRYCGSTKGPFHADHVYPFVKGGETSMENMATACARCNLRKHASVGMWPLPIGYFQQTTPKHHSPWITLITLFGVVVFTNGTLIINDGFTWLGKLITIVGVAIAFLSISWNLTRY